MAAEEEFERIGIRSGEDYRTDAGRNGHLREDAGAPETKVGGGTREPLPRAAGSPLPMGTSFRPFSRGSKVPGTRTSVPPPGHALSVSPNSEGEASSGMQWFMGVMKQALPFVQKLLPLLDGQIATAAVNVLTARPHTLSPRVNLQPIENRLADLQVQHANVKEQLADQNTVLKRVEDRLEMVREATDRNTLEQQELIEDIKKMSSRTNRLALLFLVLLVISVLVNFSLFLHIKRVLP